MKQNQILTGVGLIVLLVVAAYFSGILQMVVPINNPAFILATGDFGGSNIKQTSGVGDIAGYHIEFTKADLYEWYTGTGQCKPNTCSGTQTSVDSYGCPLYTGATTSAFYRCDSSGSCCGGYNSFGQRYCGVLSQGTICDGSSNDCLYSTGCRGGAYTTPCNYYAATTPKCGGMDLILNSGIGCGFKLKVTNSTGLLYQSNISQSSIGTLSFQNLDITAPTQQSWNYGTCYYAFATARFYPSANSFDINISPAQTSYFQGDNATINIYVKSQYNQDVVGELTTTVCTPTFAGQYCQDYVATNQLIRKATTTPLNYQIPTSRITDQMTVKTNIKVYYNINTTTGFNYDCGTGLQDVALCSSKIVLASTTSDTKTIMINPKPLYLSEGDCTLTGCITGYECQASSKLCIRSDVKSLTCQQLGCPVVSGHTYACTSAGFCAETVTIYKDCTTNGCPSGFTCENSSGTCIKTELIQTIVQCQQPSDCMIPCSGVTANCVSNTCSYQGSCTPITVQCFTNNDCPETPCAGVSVNCISNRCLVSGSCNPIYVNNTVVCTSISCAIENIPWQWGIAICIIGIVIIVVVVKKLR